MTEKMIIGIDLATPNGYDYSTIAHMISDGKKAYIISMGQQRTHEVCRRRARKLKQRGIECIRSRTTINGKPRYVWRDWKWQ